jgi:LPXTG-motif cell wall-anchored protein
MRFASPASAPVFSGAEGLKKNYRVVKPITFEGWVNDTSGRRVALQEYAPKVGAIIRLHDAVMSRSGRSHHRFDYPQPLPSGGYTYIPADAVQLYEFGEHPLPLPYSIRPVPNKQHQRPTPVQVAVQQTLAQQSVPAPAVYRVPLQERPAPAPAASQSGKPEETQTPKKEGLFSNRNLLIVGLILAAIGGYFYFKNKK